MVEVEPTPIAEPLDTFLREVVQTLQSAVRQGIQSEDPEVAERAFQDCKEMIDVIMQGNVQEWIG
ncbi:MAG TPA: hypothetical protein VEQ11_02505 [Chloroflexota bacterium]|nr:hypothetical protein [Chloroflexota bacterium]